LKTEAELGTKTQFVKKKIKTMDTVQKNQTVSVNRTPLSEP
jgi:hypothetical protein